MAKRADSEVFVPLSLKEVGGGHIQTDMEMSKGGQGKVVLLILQDKEKYISYHFICVRVTPQVQT